MTYNNELPTDELPVDQLVPFPLFLRIEGIGKTEGYRRLAAGEYIVFRDGARKLKVSMNSIIARRERQLRPAKFGALRGFRSTPPKHREATA